jgi:hypothetical protein
MLYCVVHALTHLIPALLIGGASIDVSLLKVSPYSGTRAEKSFGECLLFVERSLKELAMYGLINVQFIFLMLVVQG